MAVESTKKLSFTEFYNVIDGKLETTKETAQNTNPSTLEKNHPVPVSTPEDVDRAVEAAKKASEVWADVPYKERQNLVSKYADGIDGIKEELAVLLVKEQGKSVGPMADFSQWFCSDKQKRFNLPNTRLCWLFSSSRDMHNCPILSM
jgi:acyl-CoA reductase-like NAD-dependent aldehyde dehydrogenase